MFRFALAAAALLAASASAQGNWDRLTTTFGGFYEQPRTEAEAIDAGWTMISDCGESTSFNGKRYGRSPDDQDLVLIFDKNGFIAGAQSMVALSAADEQIFPFSDSEWYIAGDFLGTPVYFITAYFVEPSTICSEGRTQEEFDTQGTGYAVFLQSGSNFDEDNLLPIPLTMGEMLDTLVADGVMYEHFCFPDMGHHFMNYNYEPDMDCGTTIPFQVVYDLDGEINGIVHQHLAGHMLGEFWEVPTSGGVRLIVDRGPTCLYDVLDDLGSNAMHMYFRDYQFFCAF